MDISTTIFKYLKQNLPNIDWDLGSVIRELIATPVVTLTQEASDLIDTQANTYDLSTWESDPETYTSEISSLFSNLDLSVGSPTYSEGTALVYTDASPEGLIISKNTSLTWGNYSVNITEEIKISNESDSTSSEYSNIVGYTQLSYDTYCFEVPIQATSYDISLSSGCPLVWPTAPTEVTEVLVNSALIGGSQGITASEKLQRIQDTLYPTALSLNEGLLKTLRTAFPNTVYDVQFNTTSTNSEVYVKTGSPTQLDEVQSYLESYTEGSPYSFSLVSPEYWELSIAFDYSGSSLSSTDLTYLCSMINSLAMNTSSVDDTYLSSFLSARSKELVGQAVYTLTNSSGASIKSLAKANVDYLSSDTPYSLYLTKDNLSTYNV